MYRGRSQGCPRLTNGGFPCFPKSKLQVCPYCRLEGESRRRPTRTFSPRESGLPLALSCSEGGAVDAEGAPESPCVCVGDVQLNSSPPRLARTMSGAGRLKKQATHMKFAEIPGIVKELKQATYEEKEKVSHLMDIVALHQTQNPAALVSGGGEATFDPPLVAAAHPSAVPSR